MRGLMPSHFVLLVFTGVLGGSFAAAPASGALVAQWKLDEGSGLSEPDATGNGHELNLIARGVDNNSSNVADWIDTGLPPVPSGTSHALAFDGSDDAAGTFNDGWGGVTGATPRTVSAWIKTAEKNQHNPIVAWGSKSNGAKWVFKINQSNNALRVENKGGSVVGSTDVTDNEWHHVAVTWEDDGVDDVGSDGETNELLDAKLYLDGQLETISSSDSAGEQKVNTGNNSIVKVAEDLNGRKFGADIDEVRIYNEALSNSEIESLAVIPEPASLALLAPAGLLMWRRRAR